MPLSAGLTLNAPVGCCDSSLSQMRLPVALLRGSDKTNGVGRR